MKRKLLYSENGPTPFARFWQISVLFLMFSSSLFAQRTTSFAVDERVSKRNIISKTNSIAPLMYRNYDYATRLMDNGNSDHTSQPNQNSVNGTASPQAVISSTTSGNWSDGGTWAGGVVPGSGDDVIIESGHTVTMDTDAGGINTRNSGTNTTVNAGGILATNSNYANYGTTTINGTFQINQGGFGGGTGTWTYGTSSTLIFNHTSGIYGPIDNGHSYWPEINAPINGPFNVTVANSTSGGINLGVSRTVSGTFQTAAGVALSASAVLTIDWICQVNTNGFFFNAPTYGPTSTLVYNTEGAYGRGLEWSANAGVGYPNSVHLINNTVLNYPNTGAGPFNQDLSIAKDLTIDALSSFYMGYGDSDNKSGKLTVKGNFTNNGKFGLGNAFGGDLYVAGDWTMGTGSLLYPNLRAVFFNGSAAQSINGATTFDYLFVNNTSGVTLASPVSTNANLVFANGNLTLGNHDLTIGGTIVNPDAFKYIVTNGSGQLKMTVGGSPILFPVGESIYNPITFANSGEADQFGVRVDDVAPSGFNALKSVSRQWITTEAVAGGSVLAVQAQYNSGDVNTGFNAAADSKMGLYNGSSWTEVAATVTGSGPFTFASSFNLSPTDLTTGTHYFALGKDDAFIPYPATKLAFGTAPTPAGYVGVALNSFTISALRADDSVDTFYTGPVTISKASGPGNLTGTLTVNAVAGVATFSSAQFDAVGTYTIKAESALLLAVSSGNIAITPNPAVAYYRSFATGSWNVAGSWESSIDGSTSWSTATVAPTAASHVIAIRNGHTIAVDSAVTLDQLVVADGGQLILNSTTGKLTVNNGVGTDVDLQGGAVLQVIGTGSYEATVLLNAGATINVSGKITIGDGTSSMGSGYGAFGFASASQIIWNHNAVFEWDTTGAKPEFSGKTYFPDAAVSVVPLFRITKIGSGSVGGDSPTVINGLLQLNGSTVSWEGASSKTFRNGIVAFGISKMTKSSNVGPWQIGGSVAGAAEIGGSAGSLTLNNPSGISILSNCTVTLTSSVVSSSGTFSNSGILNLGSYAISGSSAFATRTGSSLITSNSGGLVSAVAVTGTKTFEAGTNYTFNASTNTPFPTDTFGNPASLTFNNAVVYSNRTSNITVSGAVNINGTSNFALNPTTNNITLGGILTVGPNATFDNGGENRIINSGGIGTIVINGTFITRDAQGFQGANTAIPSIVPTLGAASTVEYGLNGDQAVTAFSYVNITFSGSGVKTTQNAISVSTDGLVKITGAAAVDATNNLASTDDNSTAFTMDGGRLIIGTGGAQPNMRGTYALTGGVVEFAGISAKTIRSKSYQNIEVSGSNVGNSSGHISLNGNGTFTVKSGGVYTMNAHAIVGPVGNQTLSLEYGAVFRTTDAYGFNGTLLTSVRNDIENMILHTNSTVEYAGVGQTITALNSPSKYGKLKISGTGIKTLGTNDVQVGNSLEVASSLLRIESGKTLTVQNSVTTLDDGIFIQNGASLVQITDVSNANANNNVGNIKMERITPPMFRYDFTYWSSPVKDFLLKSVSPTTLFDKFFSWNAMATPQVWKVHKSNLAANLLEVMKPGRGYTVRAPQSYPVENASLPTPPSPIAFTANFAGVPNNGTVTDSISGSETVDRWNLLGNPYPSALDATTFLSENPKLCGTLYFWTHDTSPTNNGSGAYYSYSSANYVSWNVVGSTGACLGCVKPLGKIGAGQSFFVKGKEDGIVTFKNTMRPIGDNSQFYKPSLNEIAATAERHRIWLNLTGATKGFNQALIGYVYGATNGIDSQFDGETFGGNEVTLYSVLDTKKLVIQGRGLPFLVQDEVPLGYKTTLTGNLTISIDHSDGLLENQAVYLRDNLLNVTHNLSTSNYVFTSVPGTFDNRFILRYLPQEDLANPTFEDKIQGVTIRKNEADLHVSSPYELIDVVSVYDLTGRLVFQKKQCNSNVFTTSHIVGNDQTLIVKVQLVNGGVVTGKVY